MPVYDYKCGKCGRRFNVTMRISEHGSKKTRCQKCGSSKVVQQISGFFAKTSKKS